MKIEQIYFLLCEQAIQDNTSKNLSLINVFDGISGDKLPTTFGPFWLVSRFKIKEITGTTPEKLDVKIKLTRPSGTEEELTHSAGSFEVDKSESDQAFGIVVQVPSMKFEDNGAHAFDIYVADSHVGRAELDVNETAK